MNNGVIKNTGSNIALPPVFCLSGYFLSSNAEEWCANKQKPADSPAKEYGTDTCKDVFDVKIKFQRFQQPHKIHGEYLMYIIDGVGYL